MNPPVGPHSVERFRAALGRHFGLAFDDNRSSFLGEVLQRRLGRADASADAYLLALELAPPSAELAALAAEVTVTETYFFRNRDQFRALAERVLPERLAAERSGRPVSLLSAGCASGEEAYSLAMIVRDSVPNRAGEIRIRAVDINPAALVKAARGRYSDWALRDTPAETRRKWFRPAGTELELAEEIRRAVQFDARNLAVDDPELWLPESYDAVFCRNMLMYFTPERMRAAVGRIAAALVPGGFLFLGHAETLRGVSDDFHLCHTHDTFYYRRKAVLDAPAHAASVPILQAAIADTLDVVGGGTSWVDAIRGATERVAALMPGTGAAAAAPVRPPVWDPAPGFDLLRRERFGEALRHVQARPQDWAGDADVLLLEAMLLTHDGQIPAAETACRRLLAVDDMNAGAHYVLALCHEQAGRRQEAAEQDRVAAYLDPGFAMPRLHLGLLARRAGSRDEARRELTQALFLLEREDAARLLLFGGGFSRPALVALCDLALKECGGRP
jgi:chemotaxis protein methyltransferase CheR